MTDFTIHTPETAPAASKPLLEKSLKAFGRVPGLHGVLAEAPKALEAYQVLGTLFKDTSLIPQSSAAATRSTFTSEPCTLSCTQVAT